MAQEMMETGFDYKSTNEIYAEIESLVSFPSLTWEREGTAASAKTAGLLPVNVELAEEKREYPVSLILENNVFHYTGNILSTLIPDMRRIRDEGIINLSAELAEKLDVAEGSNVKVTTEFGNATHAVKIMPELEGETAYLRLNWNQFLPYSYGLSPNKCFIQAKIERG